MKKIQLILENESKTKTESIEWGLYDTYSADKVYNLLEYTKPGSIMYPRIDIRQQHTDESTLDLATEMNTIISTVNELNEDCQISTDLNLDLEVAPHLQVKKLNTLHEIFQLYTEKHGTGINETQELLERVNILVHMMEAGPVEIDQVFFVAKQEGPIHNELDLDMTDEDHMERKPNALWGVLEMDYHTVGKDLGACFYTDDIELIKSGELRQQTQLTPSIAANFMTSPEWGKPTNKTDTIEQDKFYTWCKENKLDDYIDYTDPVYRIGRMRLGEISQDYVIGDIQALAIEFPSIKEIILINDK